MQLQIGPHPPSLKLPYRPVPSPAVENGRMQETMKEVAQEAPVMPASTPLMAVAARLADADAGAKSTCSDAAALGTPARSVVTPPATETLQHMWTAGQADVSEPSCPSCHSRLDPYVMVLGWVGSVM